MPKLFLKNVQKEKKVQTKKVDKNLSKKTSDDHHQEVWQADSTAKASFCSFL